MKDVGIGGILAHSLTTDMETSTLESGSATAGNTGGTGLKDLPEDCVAVILSHLGSPRLVARLSLVSPLFRDAARSDVVWEKLLHPSCADVVANADPREGPSSYSSKKDLYHRLCHPVKLNGGNELFWLDRPTGAICRALSARALTVIWGDDPRYWSWIHNPGGSRFEEVAYLENVCWLELRGRLVGYLTPGRYSLSWRVKQRGVEGSPLHRPFRRPFSLALRGPRPVFWDHAGVWELRPVTFRLSTADGQAAESARYLDGEVTLSDKQSALPNLATVTQDEDGWLEYVAGDFIVNSEPVELFFSLTETDGGHWKKGLCFDGVVIRPSLHE